MSPVIADLAMEDQSTCTGSGELTQSSVDVAPYNGDTFTFAHFIHEFNNHLISIDPHIQFTIEQEEGG